MKYLNELRAAEGPPLELLGQWTKNQHDSSCSDLPGQQGSVSSLLDPLHCQESQLGSLDRTSSGEGGGNGEVEAFPVPTSLLERTQLEDLGWGRLRAREDASTSVALSLIKKATWFHTGTSTSWRDMDLQGLLQPPQ